MLCLVLFGLSVWFIDVEPVQKRIESVRKPSDSSAIASNHVSIPSALLVEGQNIQAIGMIPCAELDEILDCLELGTICAPILLLSENLKLGAADLSPARSDPLSDVIGGSWWIFIHGTSLILCRTSKSTQPYQRERALIAGLRLKLRKIM